MNIEVVNIVLGVVAIIAVIGIMVWRYNSKRNKD